MALNDPDFFGEGVLATPLAPEKTLEQIAAEEAEKRRRAEEARLASIPYGTPVSQGGTAVGYQTKQTVLGDRDAKPINGHPTVSNQVVTGIPGEGADGFKASYTYDRGKIAGGAIGSLGQRVNTVGGGADSLGSQASLSMDLGNGLADQVLGSEPTVDPSHQVDNANVTNLTPVVDPSLAENDETDRALSMSQDLVDRVLNTPLQTKILADQALSNQLLIARSARGGAGAVQSATDTALGQAPALLQQGAQQSINEQVTRAGAAGQAASIYAGVAGSSADRAVRIQQGNQTAATAVMANLTQLTGQDLQFDAAKMQSIGQLARDYFNNAAQFANMSTQLQMAQWTDLTTRYGIDHNFKAAMEKIAADKGIGPLDALKMVLGAGAAIGGIATANPALVAGGVAVAGSAG
jgi:hypothetical protein